MALIDNTEYSRLRAGLLDSKLAKDNNALYQVILNLVGVAEKFARFTQQIADEKMITPIPTKVIIFNADGTPFSTTNIVQGEQTLIQIFSDNIVPLLTDIRTELRIMNDLIPMVANGGIISDVDKEFRNDSYYATR